MSRGGDLSPGCGFSRAPSWSEARGRGNWARATGLESPITRQRWKPREQTPSVRRPGQERVPTARTGGRPGVGAREAERGQCRPSKGSGGERTGKRRHAEQNGSHTWLARCKWAQPLGKAAWLYNKVKDTQALCPASPLPGVCPRENHAQVNQEGSSAPLITVRN